MNDANWRATRSEPLNAAEYAGCFEMENGTRVGLLPKKRDWNSLGHKAVPIAAILAAVFLFFLLTERIG